MTAIFERRTLTRTYFIVLAALVVLATVANYFNYTVTNAFCTDGGNISCALSSNYEFIRFLSFMMIVVVLLYVIYLAWVYDTGVTEEDTEGIEEEDLQEDIDIIEIVSSQEMDTVTPTQEFLPGFYLEVECDSTSTGRTIEHEGGELPKVLKEGNYWIPLQKEETEELVEVDYSKFEHHKPGHRVTPGYYLEIDENFESVGRYIYQERKLPPTGKSGHFWVLVVDKNEEPVTEESKDFAEREAVLSKQEAEAGFYLEVDFDNTPTGRMVEHEGGRLPQVLKEGNFWIPLEQEETAEFTEVDYSKHELHKPGHRVTPGYYLEIDQNYESVGRYIYQERKLPPTGKAGHFWVLVVDKNEEPITEEPITVEPVKEESNDFADRKVALSKQEADAGFYLEVDEDGAQTGRIIEHVGGNLPQVLKEGNYWIPLEQEETEEFIEEDYSKHELHKPGNRVTPGYYLEIDENYESVGRYIYQERKLPPTSKKRHLWVLVVDKADTPS